MQRTTESGNAQQPDPLDTWIADRLTQCSRDERLVVAVRLHRMFKARHKYGALDIATENRDWRLNAAEEIADKGFYDDCRYIAEKSPAFLALLTEIAEDRKHAAIEPTITATFDVHDGFVMEVLR